MVLARHHFVRNVNKKLKLKLNYLFIHFEIFLDLFLEEEMHSIERIFDQFLVVN